MISNIGHIAEEGKICSSAHVHGVRRGADKKSGIPTLLCKSIGRAIIKVMKDKRSGVMRVSPKLSLTSESYRTVAGDILSARLK